MGVDWVDDETGRYFDLYGWKFVGQDSSDHYLFGKVGDWLYKHYGESASNMEAYEDGEAKWYLETWMPVDRILIHLHFRDLATAAHFKLVWL